MIRDGSIFLFAGHYFLFSVLFSVGCYVTIFTARMESLEHRFIELRLLEIWGFLMRNVSQNAGVLRAEVREACHCQSNEDGTRRDHVCFEESFYCLQKASDGAVARAQHALGGGPEGLREI
jgi:hypothetical protein